jgi:hypothetical protein
MLHAEVTYLLQKERFADLRREVEHERLAKAVERNQEWRSTERWYNRYLFPLFFAIGLSVTNR